MATEKDLIKFNSGDKSYLVWNDMAINLSMVNPCPNFYLFGKDIYMGKAKDWGLTMGNDCSIDLSGNTVLNSSYIEDIYFSSTISGGSTIEIMGRDKTCDLFDCPYEGTNKEWKKQTAGSIIKNICDYFSVEVYTSPDVQNYVNFQIVTYKPIDGSCAFESIQRLCMAVGILPLCKGDGKLSLVRSETKELLSDTIERGRNVLGHKILLSNRGRYSKYTVRGQDNGSDSKNISDWTQSKGTFMDTMIKRTRPFSSFSDIASDSNKCKNMAQWIAWNRGALSRLYIYSVPGWVMKDGNLWDINKLVSIKDKWFDIQETMLIIDLDFYLVGQSARTDVTVCNKNIFSFSGNSVDVGMKNFDG